MKVKVGSVAEKEGVRLRSRRVSKVVIFLFFFERERDENLVLFVGVLFVVRGEGEIVFFFVFGL